MVVLSEESQALRKCLKSRLTVTPELRGLKEEQTHLLSALKRAVCFGESDSLIVVGPRGAGKTLLVDTCLKELEANEEGYCVVRLSGLVHTDDNLALKDIIYQLHVEEEGDQVKGSFADNLLFVLQSLKSGDRTSTKPIIFVLDEFQLFCEHRNQTLLYNLFDVAQSAQAPICVVGVTCRVDITELLEKRVKSRFSHRHINLFYNSDLTDRIEAVKTYLSLDKKQLPSPLTAAQAKKWNNAVVEALKNEELTSVLQRQLELDPSEKSLKNVLFKLISQITTEEVLTPKMIRNALTSSMNVDTRLLVLRDLAVLELCLVIAMQHHSDIYDGEPFNFEMVMRQYMKFASHNMGHQVTQRPILYKAFERLKELELIEPVGGVSKGYKKEYQLYALNVIKSQVDKAVNSYVGLPTDVAHWATTPAT